VKLTSASVSSFVESGVTATGVGSNGIDTCGILRTSRTQSALTSAFITI